MTSPIDTKGSASDLRLEDAEPPSDLQAHSGVTKIEAAHKVYGKWSKWILFGSMAVGAFVYSLERTTTYQYLAWAASDLNDHSRIATIEIARAVITSCGKPPIAKLADVSSRGTAYAVMLVFYVVGYIIVAASKNISTLGAGMIISTIGFTGISLLGDIVIADNTTLKWRGVASGLLATPYIINAFVGSVVAASILERASWRWGYGMFTIIAPAVMAPMVGILLWSERKAKLFLASKGVVEHHSTKPTHIRLWHTFEKFDFLGLLLLAGSISLILLPLTLASAAKGGWHNASMIAMVTIGAILFPVFIFYEMRFAKYPVMANRFLRNRGVILIALIGFFDFISFYITSTYLYSFVVVVKTWPLVYMNLFSQIQTLGLCIFGLVAGILQRFTHRSKMPLILGIAIRLIGCGLMIHSRGANASDAEIVISQILQGSGGGITVVAMMTTAQASVPHVDVATVIAFVSLLTEIGGAIGNGISGAVWTKMMPEKMAQHLPFLDATQRAELFASIANAAANPRGDPIREGVINAYGDVMKILCIIATVFAVPPLIIAFFVPNWYLGDQQNAIDNVNLSGERVHNPDVKDSVAESRDGSDLKP
ncbi:drug:h+ antiporter [Cristinia sonorae]|uniref:Drug:h+ antiporter n=1 Tax=Cristinia sonorae TaxID=1940300 RepID=A0A8K0UF59_9AGAR|nr:drug:h+ antiporter [Cristinia sonorae]